MVIYFLTQCKRGMDMIVLLASTMLSGMVFFAVRKHRQQEQAKALALAHAQRRRQLANRQTPF